MREGQTDHRYVWLTTYPVVATGSIGTLVRTTSRLDVQIRMSLPTRYNVSFVLDEPDKELFYLGDCAAFLRSILFVPNLRRILERLPEIYTEL